jgi:Bacterial Ig-like domain (group 2)
MAALKRPPLWQSVHERCGVRSTLWSAVCLVLVLGWAACGQVTPTPPNAPAPAIPAPTSVTITGLPSSFTVGQSVQLTASATLPDGTHLNATGQVTWQSSATAVVTVSGAGLLTVTAPGEADVSATLQGVRGIVHLVVAKPAPLVPTYDITGVVHESAPTENVLLSGATVGIHFAGCPTCPHEGQETTTDDQGRFTLPGIETAGFTLWARKPGYEATPFNVAQLPRDQHPDVSVSPLFAIIRQVEEGTCVTRGSTVRLTFPVHHDGMVTFHTFSNPAFEAEELSWGPVGQPPIRFFMYVGLTIPITGGFLYQVEFGCDGPPYEFYRLDFSHPN